MRLPSQTEDTYELFQASEGRGYLRLVLSPSRGRWMLFQRQPGDEMEVPIYARAGASESFLRLVGEWLNARLDQGVIDDFSIYEH